LVIAQICGVIKTWSCSSSNSSFGSFGSSSQTSAKNLDSGLSFRKWTKTFSLIIQPLEVFTKITSFFSNLNSFFHKKFFVESKRGI